MTKELPSPEYLRKILRYDPETGKLFWLPRPDVDFSALNVARAWNSRWDGKEAFTGLNDAGYHRGSIGGLFLRVHRVAWAMQTGAWPDGEIDHKDTDRSNNRWDNLRAASRAENQRNTGLRSNNSSGVKGIRWKPEKDKWQARIRVDGRERHLGHFDDVGAAAAAYRAASVAVHGDFGRS